MYTAKEIISRIKLKYTKWEKIFANCSMHKRLIFSIFKELQK